MEVFESLKANLVGKNARIVLPEGEEPRILQATKRLVKETEVIPVLLGNPEKIKFILKLKESWMVMRSSTLNIILNLKKWFLPWWSVARAK
ncbi:phosphate acetyltransferase domain protein [Streptococcus pneumoniae 2090008]|nr:phosphate acetyltransferase domain protein [Streptococcus pneumoniae 2090008]